MSYKPSESEWMNYLYDEMEGADKDRMEQYLAETPGARAELDNFKALQNMLRTVKDKEVIAPPIVMSDERKQRFFDFPYAKTVISIAASLLLLMVAGRLTNTQVSSDNGEVRISFGDRHKAIKQEPGVTKGEIQQMIDQQIAENNKQWETGLAEDRKKQDEILSKTLARYAKTDPRMDELVTQVANASKEQVQNYVASLQSENMKMMKDYLQLTSTEQKTYMENLLVDFSKYLQQQRNDDLRLLQTKITDVEQNSNLFKAETEQILTSIINTSGYQKIGTRN
jgi:hypothetical protein